MESQHPPVRTGGIYIPFNSRVNCGEYPCYLSGLELVKWFPVLVLIFFFAWYNRGNTEQGAGEDKMDEAKYRIAILHFSNNLTSNNADVQFPAPHKNSLLCPHSHAGRGYGYTVCIRIIVIKKMSFSFIILSSWCRCFPLLSSACQFYMILERVSSKPCAAETCMWFWKLDFARTSCLYMVSTFSFCDCKVSRKEKNQNKAQYEITPQRANGRCLLCKTTLIREKLLYYETAKTTLLMIIVSCQVIVGKNYNFKTIKN